MSARTILIMAGGTGGHIMPGLAVAEVLGAAGWRVLWLGDPARMEGRLVPARGIELLPLRFGGVRGKGAGALLKLPFTLGAACLQARRLLRVHRPDVVLGMGGYAAFPGGLMARLAGIPLVVHEQNAVAGTANRVLARFASRVLCGFPGALPDALMVGNPVRAALKSLVPPGERYAGRQGPLRVLVVGGSLGAARLNELVPEALALLPAASRPLVRHQAGERHAEAVRRHYERLGVTGEVAAFIDDMAEALGWADLVVCRAGAMTVAEVAAVGVAALFIPLPHAIDDHQTANARYLSECGGGWMMPQSGLDASGLSDWLALRQRAELSAVATHAREHASLNAAQLIADACVHSLEESA
ncbi:undecaprenyldiphospho-muramoylpentapeptide beta-N-acetylglucosaminyltransferase [Castellaniella denitrificans]|uniref:UDP-N-acetylglucosamine--N-acetylmuramyl-(pentapeptide) pyrophosphoryl-undecaprenol N-acetylglucosamine transferase n=1 Tax=Castellaniella denitrificans TaxID=56119 RepID=A0ABT4M2F4_9BURK|nr:undecaprenyldiphospho-muramoylpentapeptide beta-N-acetylglucosaminyltransferase [Castellaniella denitrificans]MCZ4329487.1 undecaprenyldiphospho-muramoylpentapeptide beta-N-acetylglucosaminyltransferase [Castellaniella denitrificans]